MAQYGIIKREEHVWSTYHNYQNETIVRIILDSPTDDIPYCMSIPEYINYIEHGKKSYESATGLLSFKRGYWVPLNELTLLGEKRCKELDLQILAELI
jgi:hypothetical protein